jgi:hypothetical protein
MISNKAKNMSSVGHINKSINVGQEGQQRFYDSCRAAGKAIKKTSQYDDIQNHTDFVVDGIGFDVKGLKQTQKEGKILLEITNVQGKMGWCNDLNKPEWIAFDFGAFFLCAKNKDLFNYANEYCKLHEVVTSVKDALHKGYQRRGRQDLMTIIYMSSVLECCEHWFLPYEEYRSPMELL